MVDTALIICVYVAWVLIFYLLLTCGKMGLCLSSAAALFWALIVGLIFILIWYFAINRNSLTKGQKTAMNVILIVAIVLPILVLLYLLVVWAMCKPKCEDPCAEEEPCPEPCPPKPKCAPKCPPKCPPKPKCEDPCAKEEWAKKMEWKKRMMAEREGWGEEMYDEQQSSVKATLNCDRNTGVCDVEKAKIRRGANVTKVNFTP
jgi:hypothetical protein